MTKKQKIQEALNRGVENIYPVREDLEKVLLSGKKLKIYNGIDPTGRLHIGHGVVLLKLRQFQELGHHIIIVIGDFTGLIGDPSGKISQRKQLTTEQVKKNAENYQRLIGKILDLKKTEFLHNAKWTNTLSPVELMNIISHFTVQRLLERDMFQKRMKAGKDIHANEFLYPVFQAYDSVAMDVDMEVGGSDQTFNMLAGRTLMRKLKGKEKFVLTTKLLEDPSGKKMGKTEGNLVALDETPDEMYGKIMSWPDELIMVGLEIATNVPLPEVIEVKHELRAKVNPKKFKMLLAYKMVELYHSTNDAIKAEEQFKKIFEEHKKPDEMKTVKVGSKNIVEVLKETGLAPSKSEARRLILHGGVKVDDTVVTDDSYNVTTGAVVQRGKRHFVRIL